MVFSHFSKKEMRERKKGLFEEDELRGGLRDQEKQTPHFDGVRPTEKKIFNQRLKQAVMGWTVSPPKFIHWSLKPPYLSVWLSL